MSEPEFIESGDRLLIARCGDVNVCPLVCYDLRFPELWRLPALASEHPAEVFTIGASWPTPRAAHWRALLIARAIENLVFVIGVNRTGRDPSHSYAGGSMIVSHAGEILAEAGDGPEVIQADLDLEALRAWRRDFPALRDAQKHLLGTIPIDHAAAESGR
jgi:predicted amidohydrolase